MRRVNKKRNRKLDKGGEMCSLSIKMDADLHLLTSSKPGQSGFLCFSAVEVLKA
jgi:hypothetical protein